MPDLPLDPPKDRPPRPTTAVAAENERTTPFDSPQGKPFDFAQGKQHYSRRDILAMYPDLRLDHLRYLEKCGLLNPVVKHDHESFFGFTDLTALRQIAGELQQGAPFRAVVRNLQASRTGQLAFDFRLDAQPARIIELKPKSAASNGTLPLGLSGTNGALGTIGELSEAEQYFLMGSLLDDGTPERIEEAVKAYRRALDHDPDVVAALTELGAECDMLSVLGSYPRAF